MKVIKADESPTIRYRVEWKRTDGTTGSTSCGSREHAERVEAGRRRQIGLEPELLVYGASIVDVQIVEEPYEPKRSHVIIVNNGDGEPRVYGRWFTARAANKSAERYAKTNPSKIGTIRVCAMLQPRR